MPATSEELERWLDLLQDPQACDTVLVCSVMNGKRPNSWGEFNEFELSDIVKAQGNGKHSSSDRWDALMIPSLVAATNKEVEIFGLVSRREMWYQVKVRYTNRGYKRDESDEKENEAWAIWTEANETLEKLHKNREIEGSAES